MSWREEVSEERPTFAPSTLGDGEEMTVEFINDGHKQETRKGEATVFGVRILEAPTGAEDMNDEPLEEDEDYNLMTSSSRLLFALAEYAEDLTGETVTIRAEGERKSFDRQYFAE